MDSWPKRDDPQTPSWERRGLLSLLVLTAVLRLWQFWKVSLNPFYDAAVRSMSGNWHNFLVAAFDPSGHTAVDKPPGSLWLQVITTKMFGFTSTSLRLPEVIAGIAAVALVYSIGRMISGPRAGMIVGLALCLLPNAVLLSRSDTPDSLLMFTMTLGAWLIVRGAQQKQGRYLYYAGFVYGLAFIVKYFEGWLVLPSIVIFIAIAYPRSKLLLKSFGAILVMLATSMLWPVLVSLSTNPPWADGSTNGSLWNTIFIFNGLDRLSGKVLQGTSVQNTGLGRLFSLTGKTDYLYQVGHELAAALILSLLALLCAGWLKWKKQPTEKQPPLLRHGAILVGLWLSTGFIVYSYMHILFNRYLEGFAPAIALTIGLSLSYLLDKAEKKHTAAIVTLSVGLAAVALVSLSPLLFHNNYILGLTTVPKAISTIALLVAVPTAISTILLLIIDKRSSDSTSHSDTHRRRFASLIAAGATVTIFAMSLQVSIYFVGSNAAGVPTVGGLNPAILNPLSTYLKAHRGKTYYEAAAISYVAAASLIAKDGEPVLVLTALTNQSIVTAKQVAEDVKDGRLHYAFISGKCQSPGAYNCTAAVRWIQKHGTNISSAVRIGNKYRLWYMSYAPPTQRLPRIVHHRKK